MLGGAGGGAAYGHYVAVAHVLPQLEARLLPIPLELFDQFGIGLAALRTVRVFAAGDASWRYLDDVHGMRLEATGRTCGAPAVLTYRVSPMSRDITAWAGKCASS